MTHGMPRFTGTHSNRIDKKGRMALPAAFRRTLAAESEEERGVFYCVPASDEALLECGGVDLMKGYQALIDALPPGDPDRVYYETHYMASAHEAAIDGDGRVVLPLELREAVNLPLEGEVCFMGLGNRFHICTRETAQRRKAVAEERVRERQSQPPASPKVIRTDHFSRPAKLGEGET